MGTGRVILPALRNWNVSGVLRPACNGWLVVSSTLSSPTTSGLVGSAAPAVLMTVVTEEVPWLSPADRVEVEPLDNGFYRLTARYGFTQTPQAQDVLDCAREDGLYLDLMKTTFFLGRETLIPGSHAGMAPWRKRLFALLSRNAQRFTDFFQIPVNRVVELGMQVRL